GNVALDLPEDGAPDAAPAVVYVRPHQFDIDERPQGRNHFRARVKHINTAGPVVKLELATEWGDAVHVEMSHERFRALQLARDVEVFISPREMRVFPDSTA